MFSPEKGLEIRRVGERFQDPLRSPFDQTSFLALVGAKGEKRRGEKDDGNEQEDIEAEDEGPLDGLRLVLVETRVDLGSGDFEEIGGRENVHIEFSLVRTHLKGLLKTFNVNHY